MNVLRSMMSTCELKCVEGGRFAQDSPALISLAAERQHFLNLILAWRPSPRRLHDSTPSQLFAALFFRKINPANRTS